MDSKRRRLIHKVIPGIVVLVGAIVFLLLYRINNEEAEKIQAVLSERRETAENET